MLNLPKLIYPHFGSVVLIPVDHLLYYLLKGYLWFESNQLSGLLNICIKSAQSHTYVFLEPSPLVEHIQIISFHVIKLNDKYTARTILKSNYLSDKNEENFYKEYAEIHSVEESKELTEIAYRKAALYVKKRKAKGYISIFEDGGLAYPS